MSNKIINSKKKENNLGIQCITWQCKAWTQNLIDKQRSMYQCDI